jgi:hypothetical protein
MMMENHCNIIMLCYVVLSGEFMPKLVFVYSVPYGGKFPWGFIFVVQKKLYGILQGLVKGLVACCSLSWHGTACVGFVDMDHMV